LQLEIGARREEFAFGVGDLAAFQIGDHLALLNDIAEALAQLDHGSDHLGRHMTDPVRIHHHVARDTHGAQEIAGSDRGHLDAQGSDPFG
jgi:hypothetical protein